MINREDEFKKGLDCYGNDDDDGSEDYERMMNPGKVDEPKWEKAKEASRKEYGRIKWPVVTSIYKKEGGTFG